MEKGAQKGRLANIEEDIENHYQLESAAYLLTRLLL
jgi:hypothetical protein